MDPELMAVFCKEYTRHMNALTRKHNASREGAKAELARVNRDLDLVVARRCWMVRRRARSRTGWRSSRRGRTRWKLSSRRART